MTATTAPPLAIDAEPSLLARRLGYAGLAPFVLGALLIWLVRAEAHPYATLALASYSAVIASFLGGIHWGLAMRKGEQHLPMLLAWGAVSSTVAWLAVMMPPESGLVIDAVLLLAGYAVDRVLYPQHGAAHWLTLRFRLSAIAALSCFIGAAGS